ncbi:MAG: hypothetical protein J6X88_09775 [Bacteroidales bacterium]|nr:hypothetical protein [Bacteroidales bacterium]
MKRAFLTTLLLLAITLVQAQDIILPKHGNPITAYNLGENNKFILYTAEPNEDADILRIAKDSVLTVRRADGTVIDLNAATAPAATQAPTPTKPTTDYPEIAEEDIHGCLITKGNKVYIPTDSRNEAECVAQKYIKMKVQEWGYWIVVDKIEQAHFVLQYVIESKGLDWAYLVIRSREYYNRAIQIEPRSTRLNIGGQIIGYHPTNDSEIAYTLNCASIFFNHLKGMLTDPDYKSHTSNKNKSAYNYFMKHDKELDADYIREGKSNPTPYYID